MRKIQLSSVKTLRWTAQSETVEADSAIGHSDDSAVTWPLLAIFIDAWSQGGARPNLRSLAFYFILHLLYDVIVIPFKVMGFCDCE